MDTLFLLRSYGDFAIALSGFQNGRLSKKIQVVASSHLKPLYDDLCLTGVIDEIPFLSFQNFGIRYQIMSCFTNRYFFKTATIHELLQLRKFVKRLPSDDRHVYFEQSTRIFWPRLFTGITNAGYIHNATTGIYECYADFLQTREEGSVPDNFNNGNASLRVLITPGSRKGEKALPVDMVNSVVGYCEKQGHVVCLAGLPSEIEKYNNCATKYRSFRELITLIQDADIIISADSLPVHLAQLMKKPHWIFYNKRVNRAWLTPFAATRNFYSTFADWEKLKQTI